jgi:hypothetical protein
VLRRVAFVLVFFCLPSAAWAGAWTLPEGSGDWFLTVDASTATKYFNDSGLASTPRYSKEDMQAWIEYGLTDRLTAIIDPSLQNVNIGSPTNAERTGLGYTEFGARYGLYNTPDWVVSAQATLRIPGTTDVSNPAAVGYTDVQADLRALVGHNFNIGGTPAFFDLEVAERLRTAGYPNEFRVDGTLGVQLFPRWMLLVQSFNVVSEESGLSILGGSYAYYKLQLTALYTITPNWWVQFGGFSTYAGWNALQENGAVVGLWHKF